MKEFSFRPLAFCESEEDAEEFSSSVTTKNPERNLSLTRKERTKEQRKSVWNVDGEIIDEPSVHVRLGCCLKYSLKYRGWKVEN